MTTHRERLEACLSGGRIDRVPVALWRHFPVDDGTPEGLAAASLHFQRTFDFDLVKVTPASSFDLRDWGARDEWRGNPEGTRDYTVRVIQHPEDWGNLRPLDPRSGRLAEQLTCLKLLYGELGPDTPMIQTIFNPLSQAKNLVGPAALLLHIRRYPAALHEGLKTIVESTRRFIEAAKETGIAGIFYAVQHAQYGLLSETEWEVFGRAYDLQVLEPAQDLWLNLLHLHGQEVMFSKMTDYPLQIINWHDRETPPSLEEGHQLFRKGVVCGGVRRDETLVLGTPAQITAEAHQAIEVTGGRRLILGTGCVTPVITPYGNIMAFRKSVEPR